VCLAQLSERCRRNVAFRTTEVGHGLLGATARLRGAESDFSDWAGENFNFEHAASTLGLLFGADQAFANCPPSLASPGPVAQVTSGKERWIWKFNGESAKRDDDLDTGDGGDEPAGECDVRC